MIEARITIFEDEVENRNFLERWRELVNSFDFQAVHLEVVVLEIRGKQHRKLTLSMEGTARTVSPCTFMLERDFCPEVVLRLAEKHLRRWCGGLLDEKNLSVSFAEVVGKNLDKRAAN